MMRSAGLGAMVMLSGTVSAQAQEVPHKSTAQGAKPALSAAASTPMALSIDAQPIGDALNEFGRQSGLHVVLYSRLGKGILSQPLSGSYTTDAALSTLLRGTGLRYEPLDEKTVAILPSQPDSSREHDTAASVRASEASEPSAEMIRLAQTDNGSPAAASPDAGAADPPAHRESRPDEIADVVVTAQKKTELLMDVPISMTVLGADKLESLRVQQLDDYVFDIPNVTYYSTGTSSPRVTLRGVNSVTGGQYNPIAITVDDSSFGLVDMRGILTSQVFDIERIEVLRGPQGTLTGSSSLGGTFNIITARPNMDRLELKGTLDYGRFDTVLRKAVVNVPVSDRLAFRTVAYTESSQGAVRNIGPGGGSSSKDHYGARVSTLWAPSDSLRFNAAVSYENLRYGLDNGLYIDRHFGGPAVTAARQALLTQLGGNYYDDTITFIQDGGTNGGNFKIDDPDHHHIQNLLGSLRATYDFGGHSLDLIYGHYEYELDGSQDLDRSEFAMQRNHYVADETVDSYELRLSSRGDGPLSWVVGATYLQDDLPQGGRLGGGAGDYAGVYPLLRKFSTYRDIETYAGFGNLFWDITPRMHLSAGVRYSHVKNAFGSASAFSEADPIPPMTLIKGELSEVDPRVALSFDLADHLMVYAQYATAFRPGYGNNPLGVGLHQTSIGLIDIPSVVDSEQVDNYEVGLKGTFLDRRMQLTAAAFRMDYRNLQIYGGNVLDPGLEFVNFDINGGEAKLQGFELETAVRAATGLELHGSVGYVDTKIEHLQGFTPGIEIPGVRPWTATLSANYERPITDRFRGNFRIDYRWQDGTNTEFEAGKGTVSEVPEFHTTSLSAGIATDRWSLTAYMENVFDEVYWVGATGGLSLRGSRAIFIPRTFGLRFGFNIHSDR